MKTAAKAFNAACRDAPPPSKPFFAMTCLVFPMNPSAAFVDAVDLKVRDEELDREAAIAS